MISTLFAHSNSNTVFDAIRPLGVSRRSVSTLVKASSAAADAGSKKALHQQAVAAASSTVTPNRVHSRSTMTVALNALASPALTGGELRRNPNIRGETSLQHSCGILQHRQRQMIVAQSTSGCTEDWGDNPLYLGDYEELVRLAAGMTTTQVHKFLEQNPDILDDILAKTGISKDDYKKKFHIDHIVPHIKGGLDDPRNYCLMPAKDNFSYQGLIPLKKCVQVGLATVTKVLKFHQERLKSDAMLMG